MSRVKSVATGKSRRAMVGGMPMPGLTERVAKAVFLAIICAVVVLPFIGVVSTSLAPAEEVTKAGGFVMFPAQGIDLSAYRSIFAGGTVTQALLVSGFITVVGTTIALFLTCTLGWALSRRGSVGNRPLLLVVLVSLLFNPGLIPTYLVVQQFGLLDSVWAVIVPVCVSAFNVIVVRAYFVGLPDAVIDSARIDGASEWKLFWHIGLPLSKALVAVIGLFYGVGYWNSFFSALLYLNDSSQWPLQLVLRTYVVNGVELGGQELGLGSETVPPQTSIQMAILMISIVPVLCVYPFIQRHFAKGVLTGAVKG
ncbi:multiple sugar transport system permease protein/putative aldouronate transport system permease protein [Kribbella aluminosa]|uniref:Multiple sugar transport system permease protein/putative aldouronate transport system permease protein n=1 Tax=Kribbella aluminosa TaxID=416017 RepID=A0ABS4UIU3_9ACTN|nr:carbohydrate ABC transporter permease [Kribbella aluminosa]MBP2351476.1 multiple sugar transport system permease protein/putative aldouronate transport system permease protein [Kribbella aluminosa]